MTGRGQGEATFSCNFLVSGDPGGGRTPHGPKKAKENHCCWSFLGANHLDVPLRSDAMSKDELLDPFGDRTVQGTAPSRKTGTVSRLGVGLFLLLVLTLVVARIIYYG